MSYENLSLSGFVKEIKEVSSGPHPRKFCFVLGAGASKTSGIKSGQELVDIWEQELLERNKEGHQKWKEKFNITDENKYEHYSQYYERRFKLPIDGYNYLEKLMESANPSIGYVMLSYILTHTNHNVVVTTNFDHLIEDAVNYYERMMPMVIGHESLAHYVTKQINRPMIIKIHRDLLLDPKNRTSELDELHESWKDALGILFSEYHPIFIGYAGNDRSLMDFLYDNHEKFNKEWAVPYWMLYKTDTMSGMVQSFLNGSEGYLIEHSGFDEVLYSLGAALDYHMPTKKEFLEDAEKRFQKLSDSIDEFTQKAMTRKVKSQEDDSLEEGEINGTEEVHHAIQKITSQTESQNLFREAQLRINLGQYEEGVQILKELIDKNPENVRYRCVLGAILYEMCCYEEALRELWRVVELEPDIADWHWYLGDRLHNMSRYEEALNELKRAVELEPNNARFHNTVGVTLYKMSRYEEALKELRRAVELEPNDAEFHNTVGRTLHEMSRYEEALKELRRAVELDYDNAIYHGHLYRTLCRMGHYEDALRERQIAFELAVQNYESWINEDPENPNNAEYCYYQWSLLRCSCHYEEALIKVKKAVELEPNNAKYHKSLSITLYELGRYEEALKELRRVIELEPDNAEYHESLGKTLHEMERYEEALKELQRAIELEPNNAEYHESLSITLHEMERYEEALEESQRAIELEPNNAEYHESLSITLDEMECYEEALEELQRALELEPDNLQYRDSLKETLDKMNH